ncbi:MAG: ABC transporter permease [Anaerolineaceae bacterium]|nr:ABC transporter permease [Anaerolineaceae bacterium]
MRKIILVLKNEFISVVFRRSFLIVLFILPLVSFGIFLLVSEIRDEPLESPVVEFFASAPEPEFEGYVDQSGVIEALPDGYETRLEPFASEAAAEISLATGEIDGYFVILGDYLESGQVFYVRPDYNPLMGMMQSDVIEYVLTYNLLDQDEILASRMESLYVLEVVYLDDQPQRDPDHALTFFLPYIVSFLFYIVIFGSASLMLNSITNEKTTRVLEIIMTSITPIEMLTGKILALGLAGLLQTIVWSSSGFAMLRLSGRSYDLPESFQLDPVILAWGIIFFLLGYALYASLMAGVGALVPNLREASQATIVIIIPLIIPLMLVSVLIQKPNSMLPVVLSLFPFTSPVAMMTRLASANVPLWQPILAAALLFGMAYLVIRSVAGMFRTQILLSGQSFKLTVLFRALLGRI